MARARVTARLGRRVAELERKLPPESKQDLIDRAIARAMIRFARATGDDDWADAVLARPDPELHVLHAIAASRARDAAKARDDPGTAKARADAVAAAVERAMAVFNNERHRG